MIRHCLIIVLSLMSLLSLMTVPEVSTPLHAASQRAGASAPVPVYSVTWNMTAHGATDVTDPVSGVRYVSERTLIFNGSATVLRDANNYDTTQPAVLTVNDLYTSTETGPCAQGGADVYKTRRYLVTPERWSGDPLMVNLWIPLQHQDGSWYLQDIGFNNLDGNQTLGYREEDERTDCDGSVWKNSFNLERDPYEISSPQGELAGDAAGKQFTLNIPYSFPYSVPPLTGTWSVTVRLLEPRDLTVNQLEVTQGLQDEVNSIPLVAGRRTVVRAYIGIGSDPGPILGVTGKLTAYRGGVALGSVEPFNPGGRIRALAAPDWRQIDDTLNFELPYAWTLEPELVLKVEVNDDRSLPEFDFQNNSLEAFVTTQKCAPLTIEYHPIHYMPPYRPPSDPSANIEFGQEFLRKIYPVGDRDLNYVEGISMDFKDDINVAGSDAGLAYLLGYSLLRRIVRPDHIYGWLAASKYNGNGYAQTPGQAAFGNDTENPNRWRRTFAHEIGHNYFLQDSDLTTTGYHWFDVYDRFIKPVPATVGGNDLLDMMVPARLEPEAWISPINYNYLFNARCGAGVAAQGQSSTMTTAANTILVSGVVFSGTTPAGELDPIYHLSSVALYIPPTPQTLPQYCVNLKNGSTLLSQHCFDVDFNIDSTAPVTATSFGIVLTDTVGLDRVELTQGFNGAVLSSRIASSHPPTVTVTFPNAPNLTLTSTETIQWTGSDLDGDPITYNVLYSGDNGATWAVVATGITTTEYLLNFANLPGTGQGLIRVEASDGFLSMSDESDYPFAVPNKAPTAVIISPPAGTTRNVGENIILQGAGLDLEENAMPDSALSWSSDKDGTLGTGRLLETTLSVGRHQITLTVMDSSGFSSTAAIFMDVLNRSNPPSWIYLPLMMASVGSGPMPAATATPTAGTPHPISPGFGLKPSQVMMTTTPVAP